MLANYGPHIQHVVDREYMADWIRRTKPIVKIMDDDVDFIKRCEGAVPLWDVRQHSMDQDVSDPAKAAVQWRDRLMRRADVQYMLQVGEPFACEGPNEVNTNAGQRFRQLCMLDYELARLLHREGVLYIAGSIGTGQPELHFWGDWPVDVNDPNLEPFKRREALPLYEYPPLLMALEVADYYGIHEYFAPRMDDPRNGHGETGAGWWIFRYRWWYPFLEPRYRKPLLITECGVDSGAPHFHPGGQGGWQSFGPGEMEAKVADYMEQLAWYRQEFRKDKFVAGAMPFLWGTRDKENWETFDLLEPREASEAFSQLIVSGAQPSQQLPADWVDIRDELPKHANWPYGRERTEEYLYKTRSLDEVDTVTAHHTGWRIVGPHVSAQWSVDGRGWPGTGYTFFIPPDGTKFLCNDLETVTFHVGTANRRALALCLEGNFVDGVEPTDAQIQSAREVLVQLRTFVDYDRVVGHKELMATICPGSTWDGSGGWKYRLLGSMDWEARALEAEGKLLEAEGKLGEIQTVLDS